ncbi:RNA polymerase sigma factor [Microlunatus soli]|uniref:RNA polymerase sigma-70 factor, ECF subfamily n=1 Tax=Microlunatus soli TaxID=630515 RepID=A0A1H1PPM3_9ACTN|nr:sigma-70 family RNA polymerase sigma factor [Microlunatus soli]SDS13080.1 RNA polymerase sigma-70 factor, ECF subfamily [Microlunatus soli]
MPPAGAPGGRPGRSAVEDAISEAHRRDWGTVLAATVRVARDLDLAEDCVQEAFAAAVERWQRDGIPDRPAGWLVTTARRRAVDAIRRESTLRTKLPLLVEPEEGQDMDLQALLEPEPEQPSAVVADERLRLIFLCCHPALAQDAQLALTLRLVCGLSTPDIARLLLVSESTMAARITRAKKKITLARIPFRMPRAAELPDRLRAVLGVIHLVFTSGHVAPSGPALVRADLTDHALHLARVLRQLMPDEPEAAGLLALLLVTDARRETRVDSAGRLLRLEEQDRTRWDRVAIAEADTLIVQSLRSGRAGRYALQAAIAALYADAPSYQQTDWTQIVTLYDRLLAVWPSPVVALNRTVPLSMAAGPAAALTEVERLEAAGGLERYGYLPAVKADLLRRLGRSGAAAEAYRQAIALTDNDTERDYLRGRLAEVAAG